MALEGRTVVFYGSLSFNRSEATAKAKAAGAKTTSSFTAKTDLLIVRPPPCNASVPLLCAFCPRPPRPVDH